MKIKIKYLTLMLLACLLFINAASVVKCEFLTHKHCEEFSDAYKQNTMLGDMEFFKVLEYKASDTAKVYYVSKGKTMGNILNFEYDAGEWNEVSWNTTWSDTGSADKIVYPYWWHIFC